MCSPEGCAACFGGLWPRAASSRSPATSTASSASAWRQRSHSAATTAGSASATASLWTSLRLASPLSGLRWREAWADVPEGFGLLVSLRSDGVCRMRFVQDAGAPRIHPNIRVPKSLLGLKELGGGGSGVTVVRAEHAEFGPVVFKHGGENDMLEFFALATIEEQLRRRGSENGAAEAATYMWDHTPDFSFLYVSPAHLRSRGMRLWGEARSRLKGIIAKKRAKRLSQVFVDRVKKMASLRKEPQPGKEPQTEAPRPREANGEAPRSGLSVLTSSPVRAAHMKPSPSFSSNCSSSLSMEASEKELPASRDKTIRLVSAAFPGSKPEEKVVQVVDDRLQVLLETREGVRSALEGRAEVQCCSSRGGDYDYLRRVCTQLAGLQQETKWKFTLAQKAIGAPGATTGAWLLKSGRLQGELLRKLISEYVFTIRKLQQLTYSSEREFVEEARREVERLTGAARGGAELPQLSPELDAYVGHAVNKNFRATSGRFARLRRFGQGFREGRLGSDRLRLTPGEVVPARLLGRLLERGACMESVFSTHVAGSTPLDSHGDSWLPLLSAALRLKGPAALERLWTCGVSDGGLHNLFFGEGDGLWLFDMGKPRLMSLPGFLMKFLFSFFHTLGMEETGSPQEPWVVRFQPDAAGELLRPTDATERLLLGASVALHAAVSQLVAELFGGELEVAPVLIRYVVLQLMSDASFCLDKWQDKGGGTKDGAADVPSEFGLEKWLWRALWDIFAAGYVASQEWIPAAWDI